MLIKQENLFDDILALFFSSTESVNRVSGNSVVISKSVFNGKAVDPALSRLIGILMSIVISRSVARSVVFSSVASSKTQPSIGSVDRVGVAFESFCKAC